MTSPMPGALILTQGKFQTPSAKTAHGLVRGTSRFLVQGVVDDAHPGRDAGELLDGRVRNIPVYASLAAALSSVKPRPEFAIVGLATVGGGLPDSLRALLHEALEAGLSIVNGLHDLASTDPDLAAAAQRSGAKIIDIRKPRPFPDLKFWTGRIREVAAPRIAVLGTDCALGKRTTCSWLKEACNNAGLKAEMIYTGQTGWLQGHRHGFILDATPNDFVSGELEHAIVSCWEETRPELILIEGQSGLRNPTGPCGAELLLSGGAGGVILQHAPARTFYKGTEHLEARIPELADEIDLISRYGARTLGVALNEAGLEPGQAEAIREALEQQLSLPVVRPLHENADRLMDALGRFAGKTVAP
jgi:uncharacterized NAD-dependent epimerase/dehydratase family protein